MESAERLTAAICLLRNMVFTRERERERERERCGNLQTKETRCRQTKETILFNMNINFNYYFKNFIFTAGKVLEMEWHIFCAKSTCRLNLLFGNVKL